MRIIAFDPFILLKTHLLTFYTYRVKLDTNILGTGVMITPNIFNDLS